MDGRGSGGDGGVQRPVPDLSGRGAPVHGCGAPLPAPAVRPVGAGRPGLHRPGGDPHPGACGAERRAGPRPLSGERDPAGTAGAAAKARDLRPGGHAGRHHRPGALHRHDGRPVPRRSPLLGRGAPGDRAPVAVARHGGDGAQGRGLRRVPGNLQGLVAPAALSGAGAGDGRLHPAVFLQHHPVCRKTADRRRGGAGAGAPEGPRLSVRAAGPVPPQLAGLLGLVPSRLPPLGP